MPVKAASVYHVDVSCLSIILASFMTDWRDDDSVNGFSMVYACWDQADKTRGEGMVDGVKGGGSGLRWGCVLIHACPMYTVSCTPPHVRCLEPRAHHFMFHAAWALSLNLTTSRYLNLKQARVNDILS